MTSVSFASFLTRELMPFIGSDDAVAGLGEQRRDEVLGGDLLQHAPLLLAQPDACGERLDDLEIRAHVLGPWHDGLRDADIVMAVRAEDVVVFDPHCTHLGCPLSWSNGAAAFVCPCHGGMFGSTGAVLSGPAPRPMIRYETRIEGGEVFIGTFVAEGA